jgi:hypothetical protein
MSMFPTFPAFALVAASDWLMQVNGGDDVSTLFKIHFPGKDLVSHEARTVCHSSASGYATHRMGHTVRS